MVILSVDTLNNLEMIRGWSPALEINDLKLSKVDNENYVFYQKNKGKKTIRNKPESTPCKQSITMEMQIRGVITAT